MFADSTAKYSRPLVLAEAASRAMRKVLELFLLHNPWEFLNTQYIVGSFGDFRSTSHIHALQRLQNTLVSSLEDLRCFPFLRAQVRRLLQAAFDWDQTKHDAASALALVAAEGALAYSQAVQLLTSACFQPPQAALF